MTIGSLCEHGVGMSRERHHSKVRKERDQDDKRRMRPADALHE
jgi:hypothetical protein